MRQGKRKDNLIFIIPGVLLVGLSVFLLKSDVWTFWTWYLLAMVLGIAAMPATGMLFAGFDDKGWMFSKVLAIAASGFAVWFLACCRIIRFSTGSCVAVTLVLAFLSMLLLRRESRLKVECFPVNHIRLILTEELVFLAAFLLWTYLAGFHPAAYGTEKFMDYGFMEAMMRSEVIPARDLWYSEGNLNYYYGGQYFAVFLTKLSGSRVELTYNLMRTFVAGFAFALPFSLVCQMTRDLFRNRRKKQAGSEKTGILPGLIAGAAVSIAGNVHYVVYRCVLPWIQKMTGAEEIDSYWFPNATRYIGFRPEVSTDHTIHEFPCYSFVLGDLHAHVVNIMFVLLLLGLLYAYTGQERRKSTISFDSAAFEGGKSFLKRELLHPQVLICSALLGMFHWTNYWDFVIYFVVTGGVVMFTNFLRFRGEGKLVLLSTLVHAAEMAVVSTVIILPFTLQFETMVQGVALCKNHSMPHQLLILWGLPAAVSVLLIGEIFAESIRKWRTQGAAAEIEAAEQEAAGTETAGTETAGIETAGIEAAETEAAGTETAELETAGTEAEELKAAGTETASTEDMSAGTDPDGSVRRTGALYGVMSNISIPDLFVIITSLCALGLVCIPEVVYVRDIYEAGNARANTMFKLTYQAYIMFGLTIGYGLCRILVFARKKIMVFLAMIGLVLWVWTLGYFGNSVRAWFGRVWDPSGYRGLNALKFLDTDFYEDVGAIDWLKENVKDVQVVLEANGDSYTGYERVSATTGLPTILGWYVHEWLWRSNVGDLNSKSADVETIYTSQDEKQVLSLLLNYDVSYVIIGSKEREKYGDRLNTELLTGLGSIVYQDPNYSTLIVKIR